MTFTLDDEQVARLRLWQAECEMTCPTRQTVCGGRYVFTFCRTSIGDIVTVRDDGTGQTIDLTGDL